MDYALNFKEMVINFDKVKFDKKCNTLWFYVGERIIGSLDLTFYKFVFDFKGEHSGAYFFKVIDKR